MNWLDFIASIIGSLAWPVAMLAAVLLFRSKLVELLPRIGKLRYKEFELEFRESMRQLGAEAKELERDEPPVTAEPVDAENQLYALAEISPRAAILESWLAVEASAVMALRARKIATEEEGRKLAPLKVAKLIETTNVLSGEELKIFHKLRDLRNRAVHLGDPQLTARDVAEYIDLSFFLMRQFRKSVHPSRVSGER